MTRLALSKTQRIPWKTLLLGSLTPLGVAALYWLLEGPLQSLNPLVKFLITIAWLIVILIPAFLLTLNRLGSPSQRITGQRPSTKSDTLEDEDTHSGIVQRARTKAQLQAILDYADEGIVTLNHQYIIDTLNSKAKKLLGCTAEEACGKSCDQFFFELERDPLPNKPPKYIGLSKHLRSKVDPRISPSGDPTQLALRLDGKRFPIELSTSIWESHGQVHATLIFRDITERTAREAKLRRLLQERKQHNEELSRRVHERTCDLEKVNQQLEEALEQAKTETRARDMFLATVSHELRTPLTHIQGFAQFLEQSNLDDQQRRDISRVRAAANHLLDLVNDILDYQGILLNRIELKKERFDACVSLHELVEMNQARITKCGNVFEVNLPDHPCYLCSDQRRFKQVLNNLLHNASKFAPDGTVYLHAWTIDQDRSLRVVVRDMGPGISEEQQVRIWEPFKSHDPQNAASGTGMGLPITKSLMELMGGDIILSSYLGRGTRFEIVLPLAPEEGAEPNHNVSRLPALEATGTLASFRDKVASSAEITMELDLDQLQLDRLQLTNSSESLRSQGAEANHG